MRSRSLRTLLVLTMVALMGWISMHLLLVCLDLSITAGELKGRVAQDYLSSLNRGIGLTLLAVLAAQLFLASLLMQASWKPMRRLHLLIRFCIGLVGGTACTALLVFISLSTGGGLVVPSLEHWLKNMLTTS